MKRHVFHLIRLAFAAALLYLFAFAGLSAEMQPIALVVLLAAIVFEAIFWVTLFRGRGRGHVQVDREG